MAGFSVFRQDSPQIASVNVDVILGEIHDADGEVSTNVIEDASTRSDHITLQPRVLEIEGEISNFDGNDANTVGERAKTAFEELLQLRNERVPVEVLTRHALYENMVLHKVHAEHLAPFTGKLGVVCTFTQIDSHALVPASESEANLAGADFLNGAPVAKTASGLIDAGELATTPLLDLPDVTAAVESMIDNARSLAVDAVTSSVQDLAQDAISGVLERAAVLPFTSDGARKFLSNLDVPNVDSLLTFESFYSYTSDRWFCDILDAGEEALVDKLTICPEGDLLSPFPELAKFGQLRVVDTEGGDVSGADALGNTGYMVHFQPGDLETIIPDIAQNRVVDVAIDTLGLGRT